MATGLIALAILGGDGPTVDSGNGSIPYQVRVMTLDGLEWRTEAYPKLRPVARQGTSSIWTADRALGETLEASARSVTASPRCSMDGGEAVTIKSPVYYQGHWERVADGPIGHATKLAWKPETSKLEEGFRARVACRKLDQGVLARVQIEESHVNAIHKVLQAETFPTPNGMKVDFVPAGPKGPDDVTGFQIIQQAGGGKESALGCYVQVPEISSAMIDGEWLVPADSVLVVTLGVDTVADDRGMAVVRERVAVIEFGEGKPAKDKDEDEADSPRAEVAPAPPVLVGALPMPAMPSRSAPEAIDVDGKLVELPPLPEGLASTDLDRIKPDPDRPSPQMVVSKADAADPQVARAGYVTDAVAAPAGHARAVVPVADAPATCFLQKLMESKLFADFDLDIYPEADGKTLHLTVNRHEPAADAKCEARCPSAPAPKDVAPREEAESGLDTAVARSAFLSKVFEAFDKLTSAPDECPEPCDECPAMQVAAAAARAAFGSPEAPAAMPIQLGVNIGNGGGECLSSTLTDLNAAIRNPGKTQTAYVALPGKFALELKATLVPNPEANARKMMTTEAERLDDARDEWERFWFMGQPAHLKPAQAEYKPDPPAPDRPGRKSPFRNQGGLKP